MKIAVISGKGGSGKSSISAALIALGKKVVAVDCDVDASNLPLLFVHHRQAKEDFVSGFSMEIDASTCTGCGRCAAECAYHAMEIVDGKARVNPFFCEDCRLCERLCPTHSITLTPEARSQIYTSSFPYGLLVHGHLKPGDDNSGKMIAHLRDLADEVMEAEHIDLQIMDGPPGIGCPVISTITGADRIVIVTEPTRSGLSDLKRACKVAASFCPSLYVIINKCDMNEGCRKEIVRACEGMEIPVIAQLPFSSEMVDAQVAGKSIMEYAPESEVAKKLAAAAEQVL